MLIGVLGITDSIESNAHTTTANDTLSKREMLTWLLVLFLGISLASRGANTSSIVMPALGSQPVESIPECVFHLNDRPPHYYNENIKSSSQNNDSYYEPPTLYPKDAGLVQRVWCSNASPSINANLRQGSCWCSADEWCMCTPSLAVDIILTSGPDHVWLVRREDTGLLALM